MFLHEQHCEAKKTPTLLTEEQINTFLKEIPQWHISENKKEILCTFKFKDYHQTLLFINAVAEIVHFENHHPDIKFGYNYCAIHFSTHSAGGITIFDLICAAQIEQLLSKKDFEI